jgi:NDP-sugar pyrophosphorylase family protein
MTIGALNAAECDAVILAGGLGTRIRTVLGDTPKLLAPVGRHILLDLMLNRLAEQGVRRVLLALGYRAAAVVERLAAGVAAPVELVPVVEPAPLGTAGAVRHLRARLRPGPALVMNGDTLMDLDIARLLARHREVDPPATLACIVVPDAGRFGRVIATPDDKIERFAEKGESGPGLVNAGAYVLSPGLLDRIAESRGASLETDFFQTAPAGSLAISRADGRFVDIGTPEGFAEGGRLFG